MSDADQDQSPRHGGWSATLAVLTILAVRGIAMWLYIPLALVIWPFHAAVAPGARVGPRTYYTWVDEWFIYAAMKLLPFSQSFKHPRLGQPAAGKTRLIDAW